VAIVSPHCCAEKIFPLKNAGFLHPFHAALTPLVEDARSTMRNLTLECNCGTQNNKFHSSGPEEGPSQGSAERNYETQVEGRKFLPFPVTQQQSAEKQQEDLACQHLSLLWLE